MLVAFSVTPLGVGDAVGEYVADAVRVVRDSGLPNHTDAMFTTVEGDWDEVMAVVKQAVDAVAAKAPRVSVVLKADIRPGVDRCAHRQDGEPGAPPGGLNPRPVPPAPAAAGASSAPLAGQRDLLDERGQPGLVEQVRGPQRLVVAHVVETCPDLVQRHPGQRRPGHPVGGELDARRRAGRRPRPAAPRSSSRPRRNRR